MQFILAGWYTQHLRPDDRVLDLCSAYDSHLPCTLQLGAVQGHGMCQGELAANPVLRSYVVCDLNKRPRLPLQSDSYDAVLCCMGLQYLRYPEQVLAEVHRVLKPGGKLLIAFSSHCFPEKTLAAWLERTLRQQVELVKRYGVLVAVPLHCMCVALWLGVLVSGQIQIWNWFHMGPSPGTVRNNTVFSGKVIDPACNAVLPGTCTELKSSSWLCS